MNFTWALALIPFVSAGAGAYFGGYLKKKGENLATHEDIDKLISQVSAVTTTTKNIEAKISSDLWDKQKQWELKRDILFEAAKQLPDIDNKLLSLQTFWEHLLRGEIENNESRIRLEHRYVTEWQDCVRAFEKTESLILVICSKETVQAVAELIDLLRNTAAKIVNGALEEYLVTKAERLSKFAVVRVAIRKELGISFDPEPRSQALTVAAKDKL